MHDIWNPWHGCIKKSDGCKNCYMYFLDETRGKKGSDIYLVKNMFDYPLHKNKDGSYKVKSGERIRVCMTSDFFLKEADEWRKQAWKIMQTRSDVVFIIITKRPERILETLPKDYDFSNIELNVTTENQEIADARIPIMLELPFRHKGIVIAPFIAPITLAKYLETGMIEQVCAGGENYKGSRPLQYEWVKNLSDECKKYKVNFCFFETGTFFIKDGKTYILKSKSLQSKMAHKSSLSYFHKKIDFNLKPLPEQLALFNETVLYYKPIFKEKCSECGSKPICNGCSSCGKC